MKLVSIIIPTHNGSNYIVNAIESVLGQDYKNLEVIIVDDNGKDSPEQLKTYEKVEPYLKTGCIKYIVHEVNKNGAAARNTGFKASTGDYIAFLDDDDTYLPSRISSAVSELESLDETWGMTYCSAIIKYSNNKSYKRYARKSGNVLYEVLLHEVIIGSNSLLIRRNVYESIGGFDESFKRHQDYEFSARVAADFKVKAVREIGYRYNSVIGRNKPRDLEMAKLYRKHYLEKMLPYIRRFSERKQHIIIYSNIIEVISGYIRRGKLIKFIKSFNEMLSGLVDNIRLDSLTIVIFKKVYNKIIRKIKMKINSI